MKKLGTFTDPLLDRQIEEIISWGARPYIPSPGGGVNLRTPDGTKVFRLSVNNTGAVVATDVTGEYGP